MMLVLVSFLLFDLFINVMLCWNDFILLVGSLSFWFGFSAE
jgi:hypothetical protein